SQRARAAKETRDHGARDASRGLLGRWTRGEPRREDSTRPHLDSCVILSALVPHPMTTSGGRSLMRRAFFVAPLVLALALVTTARATERGQVPDQYKWRLT